MSDISWDLSSLKTNVTKIIKEMPDKVEKALWEGVVIIGNESEKEVPLDVGTLRDSWETEPLTEEIGYEFGYHEPYAARLHEHPEYHFQNGRKAKYLEDPVKMNKGDWQGRIESKLKSEMQ